MPKRKSKEKRERLAAFIDYHAAMSYIEANGWKVIERIRVRQGMRIQCTTPKREPRTVRVNMPQQSSD